MSRASIRMKQYRPVSADFTKVGTGLSAVFGLNQESNDEKSSNSSNGVLLINYRKSSTGSSPSNSPRLSNKKFIEDGSLNSDTNGNCDEISTVNGSSPKLNNLYNSKSSPKVPSSLATKNKNIEGRPNLIAPIAVTEELEADDCETESETNEDLTSPILKSESKIPGNIKCDAKSRNPAVTKKSTSIKTALQPLKFSSSTPSKLDSANGKFPVARLQVSRSMEDDNTWWSDDETDRSNTFSPTSGYTNTYNAKSLSLPAKHVPLQQCHDVLDEGSVTSCSNTNVTDVNSANQLSSSIKSCHDASAFESFSCTDEDDDDDGDESDQDSTSLESSITNNRSQDDSKSRFIKPKFLRAKFRDSKTWGKKSITTTEEKEGNHQSNNGNAAYPNNGLFSPLSNSTGVKSGSNFGSSNSNSSISPSSSSYSTNTEAPESRLSRLFSLRRSVGPGTGTYESKQAMPRVAEEEEQMLAGQQQPTAGMARQQPPSLAPAPQGLGLEQLKRRHIVASLVHSENNYVTSLQRLVNDYKKPLEESNPPILNSSKVALLFHRIPEILHYHTLFRIALSEAIANWDRDEAIGDVFVATFSKAVVLEIYSEFINNFTTAMECARQESKRKSALADFLKVKQITAQDRVSFFGLMVKPVQRFPQFILLLQDLLKETPQGHSDRMALQLALTTLESLAEMLNERKREAEQYAAFRDKMRSISSGKFASATRSVLMSSTTTSSGINTLNSSNTNHILDNGPSSLSHLTLDRTSSGGCSGSGPSSLNSLGGNGGLSQPAGPPLRFLLREDNVTQLEFNSAGMVARSKQRRLLLLNDLLVCVSVAGRNSEVDFASTISTAANERLTLKWAVPVGDVELVDGTAGGTLARLLSAGSVSSHGSSHGHGDHHMGPNYGGGRKRTSLTRSLTPSSFIIGSSNGPSVNISSTSASASNSSPYSQNIHENGNGQQGEAENLAQDMNDLMHDFDVVSRMSSMIGSLRGVYEGLNTELTAKILSEIQRSIRQKDEEMSMADASCLQFVIRGRGSKDKPESYTFQCRDPNVKKEWIVELRLAQLALDPSNSPGWDVLEQERSVSTKMPLFVKSYNAFFAKARQSEVTCGSSYTIFIQTATRSLRPQTYVWVNAHDGISSHLRIFGITAQHTGLKELGTVSLPDSTSINGGVRCIQYVPGLHGGVPTADPEPLRGDLVWVGTDSKRLILYSANDPERGTQLGSADLPSEVMCMRYHCDAVWVGLASGALAVFRRNIYSLSWDVSCPHLVSLGSDPIMSLLPVHSAKELPGIYAACGKRVCVIDAFSDEQLRSFVVQPRSCSVSERSSAPFSSTSDKTNDLKTSDATHVHQMAQSGVGLWISLRNSSTICLYHTETFRHLQDINIASNVSRVLAARDVSQPQRSIHVTSLMASRGLLWVGTNVGIALTVPLPRLEGVPIISGRANISYHAHYGPVTFFLNIQHKVVSAELPPIYQNENQDEACSTNLSPLHSTITSNDSTMMIREESEQDLRSEEGDDDTCSFMTQVSQCDNDEPGDIEETQTDALPILTEKVSDSRVKEDCEFKSNAQMNTSLSSSNSSTPPPLPTSEPPKTTGSCSPEGDKNLAMAGSDPCETNMCLSRGPTKLRHRNSSPPLRTSRSRQRFAQDIPASRRFSKTLPRGFSLANQMNSDAMNEFTTDVYGLYGELFNVRDYDYCDGSGEFGRHDGTIGQMAESDENRKSDPEISTIPYRVSTLDRRMRMKSSRPRSLDMSSTWSVESRGSISSGGNSTTTSSSEAGSERPSPNVSRNASFQSNGQPMTTSPLATNCSSQAVNTQATLTKVAISNLAISSSSTSSVSSVNGKPNSIGKQMQPNPPLPAPTPKADIPKIDAPKTVTTLMGGRGYINWRRVAVEKQRTSALAQINNYDAFLVIWEMKL